MGVAIRALVTSVLLSLALPVPIIKPGHPIGLVARVSLRLNKERPDAVGWFRSGTATATDVLHPRVANAPYEMVAKPR